MFCGRGFGATGRGVAQTAEVVFNTAMTGYQEALTDPSYAGQVLVMTAPLIGNTGVNEDDPESARVQVAGLVVRELCRRHSNYRATRDLASYLAEAGVLGVEGIDTRALTRRLRVAGVMRGVVSDDPRLTDEHLVSAARHAASMAGQNLVPRVGCSAASSWSETLGAWSPSRPGRAGGREPSGGAGLRVLALDCGAKRNILRNLAERGCDVRVVPHSITADDVRRLRREGEADGLFISNGPGDPAAVKNTVRALTDLMAEGEPIPTFGICLGHQLLALALGAKTYKLKFGHRGANQPVLNILTGVIEITSQNHGFAVDRGALEAVGGAVTHINLNDGTVAGFGLAGRPVFAVQHHPEAAPGPHDSGYLFDAFVNMMRSEGTSGIAALGAVEREAAAPGRI